MAHAQSVAWFLVAIDSRFEPSRDHPSEEEGGYERGCGALPASGEAGKYHAALSAGLGPL
ncbi:hypothetical protein D3C75_322530 [compost metagenome]